VGGEQAVKISAGRLDDRVTFLEPQASTDAFGGPLVTYTPAGTRWASRVRYQPSEVERDPQRQTVAAVNLLVRLDALARRVTTKWRVLYDGEELEIAGLDRSSADGSLVVSGRLPTGGGA
jgi:head-tail adaptor